MNHLYSLLHSAISALEVWSPVQLLAVAAITILLGYVGIVARFAR